MRMQDPYHGAKDDSYNIITTVIVIQGVSSCHLSKDDRNTRMSER